MVVKAKIDFSKVIGKGRAVPTGMGIFGYRGSGSTAVGKMISG
jgi:hypothetical protein